VQPRKILITGAGGFIGYQLSNFLAKHGHQVIGVDLQYPQNSGAPLFNAQTNDLRDWPKMKKLLAGIDVVMHLASAHLKTDLKASEYWDINVYSIPKLLEIAHASGVGRFIHVSSAGVYGNLTNWPADEKTACRPQSIYGDTKLAGENEVKKFSEKTGFPAIIIRPTWVYGATCPRLRKLYTTLRQRTFIMIGSGKNLRHPIYISDLLEAFDLVMENAEAVGDLFIIGGERELTTREIIKQMCNVFQLEEPLVKIPNTIGKLIAAGVETAFRCLKMDPPISRRALEFFDTNNAFDISRAKQVLGFKPQFSFEAGLYDCRDALIRMA
jgi:nucleoside-diphosphate-sugar epimerase